MEPTLLVWALVFGGPLSMVWVIAEVSRRSFLPGSHARYQLATVERSLRYIVPVYFVFAARNQWLYGETIFAITNAAGLAVWTTVYLDKRRRGDDDDDFWTGLGKKLKRWASSVGRSPATNSA